MRKSLAVVVVLTLFAVPLAAESVIDEAHAALDRNDPQAAVNLLEPAVAQSPNDAEAHYLLGVAYGKLAERSNVFRQASLARRTRAEFEKAVAIDPNHVMARMSLVEYYTLAPNFFGGSIARAQEQAAEIAKRNPASGHRANAFIYGHLKRYDLAAAELRQAAALEPDDMPTLFEIGHLAAVSGENLAEGQQALEKYVGHTPSKGDPSLDQALDWLAQIYEREGRTADAAQARAKAERMAAR
jgi:tetratricopeptide (TPR) repeat protein